jgi:hypothetical protein
VKTLCLLFVLSVGVFAQTVSLGGIATPPDGTAALNTWLTTQSSGVTANAASGILVGDATMTLPAGIVAACVESYNITVLTSASNVTTANVSTTNVPLGVRVTIVGATTSAYNTTFATTSAPASASTLTWALTIADGTYSNTSPSTNGYPTLTYAHCGIVIDSEAIEVTGTTDGTNYSIVRGALGTTAAAHSSSTIITALKYPNIRGLLRSNAQAVISAVINQTGTTRLNVLIAQVTALQVQILALRAVYGL